MSTPAGRQEGATYIYASQEQPSPPRPLVNAQVLVTEGEARWIHSHPERCPVCQHLLIFHEPYDDPLCYVGDCACGEQTG